MTYPGAPSIYYGDEIGMQGGHDPANRGAFPWHRTETWDTELLHEYQRLIALRRARPALRRGTYKIVAAAAELFAHARQLGDETLVAVFNTARSSSRIELNVNGLVAEETVLEVTARLIVNRVALKLHPERLRLIIGALRKVTVTRPGR